MTAPHADEGDKRYEVIRESILKRDRFKCVYCSFVSHKYQQLHHLNDDHADNRSENLVTACPFCHQCFHLAMSGIRKSGIMIWLPEISQADLNNLCRAIFVAIANNGDNEEAARSLYRSFEVRRSDVRAAYGNSFKPPVVAAPVVKPSAAAATRANSTAQTSAAQPGGNVSTKPADAGFEPGSNRTAPARANESKPSPAPASAKVEPPIAVKVESYLRGADDPMAFAQAFLNMSPENYANRASRISHLRLLPRMQAFAEEIAYWRSDAKVFGGLSDAEWKRFLPEIPYEIEEEDYAEEEPNDGYGAY